MESFWKRVLTRQKADDEKPREAPKADDSKKPGLPEKVLNVPVGRRHFLGGAASSAGALAGNAANALSGPQTIVVREGVREIAAKTALILQYVNNGADSAVEYGPAFSYHGGRALGLPDHAGFEAAFKMGVPIDSAGEIDEATIRQLGDVSYNLWMAREAKVGDIKDPEILASAYRLDGRYGKSEEEIAEKVATTRRGIETLQRLTGVGDDASVSDIHDAIARKGVEMMENITTIGESLPSDGSKEYMFKSLQQDFGRLGHGRQDLTERLKDLETREKRVRRELVAEKERVEREASRKADQMESEARTRAIQERKEQKKAVEAEKAKRYNDDISERDTIKCSVETEDWSDLDKSGAKVFYITSEQYEGPGDFQNLTRMHIMHLRQMLGAIEKDGSAKRSTVLEDFKPADTQVQVLKNRIRVSTTDPLLQQYLSRFHYGGTLHMPNRVQMKLHEDEKR